MSQRESAEARQLLEHYCREGSQPAFDRFYRQQSGRLWRFLRFRGVAEDAAYDLVAEAFLRFIQVVCKDLRAPVALLYRITLNLRTDAWRRSQTASDYAAGMSVQGHHDEPAEQIHLRRLIGRLPESEQNLLLMRYWIGLTHREIAEATGQPAGTVRRRTAELLEQLRQEWEQDSEHDGT
ncbi:RNA polymerase sigma-70 factor (ECF subfamily) [Methylohalomonas lacus]|uniref:RNA polymerase sigma-70 factor (ECF subfamily) n=1 Tax=Methylohalomonas lacus TaxID=398773 RepID=A0AAE3HKC6_9GAMM|nr:sigma-70 family RNA polymerase sigma factor [Methylohalomonas lacus]MCS3903945.1 RNA polymerase sigma-70 factor (ECF subfamily) [Methylohalomonas lacus]